MEDLNKSATLTFTQVLMQLSIVQSGVAPGDLVVKSTADELRKLAGIIEQGGVADVQRCLDFMLEIEAA